MAWTSSNPVRIGYGTRKSHYDVLWDNIDYLVEKLQAPAGTICLFGSVTPPTGWTRKENWGDDSMLCYQASGSLGSGGSGAAPNTHSHTGNYTLDDDDAHVHAVNTIAMADNNAHTHGESSADLSSEEAHDHSGDHTHTLTGGFGSEHNHQVINHISGDHDETYDSNGNAQNLQVKSDGRSGLMVELNNNGELVTGDMWTKPQMEGVVLGGEMGMVPDPNDTSESPAHSHTMTGTSGGASVSHGHSVSGDLSDEGHTHDTSGACATNQYYYQEVAAATKDA